MEVEITKEKPVGLEQSMEPYFAEFEKQASEWMEKAKLIQVTDESQVELMGEARKARLAIRQIRLSVTDKHKELKEESLKKGQTLDAIKRRLVGMIEPIEETLQQQEDFAKIQEAKRKESLFKERAALLEPYIGSQVNFMQLGDMDQDTFDAVLLGQKTAKEQREFEEREKERLRIEREEQERKINEERKKWIARVNLITPFGMLWDAQAESYVKDDFNISLVEIKTDSDEVFADKCLAISNEISKRRDKELKAKEKQDQKLKEETAKRKQLEKEAEDRAEEERKRLAAEKKLKRAPDKEKLLVMAATIDSLTTVERIFKDEEATKIHTHSVGLLQKVTKYIRDNAEKL